MGVDDCCEIWLRSLKGRCHGNQFYGLNTQNCVKAAQQRGILPQHRAFWPLMGLVQNAGQGNCTRGGARVFAAPGKRLCCRPRQSDRQSILLWLGAYNDDVGVECHEHYAKLGV